MTDAAPIPCDRIGCGPNHGGDCPPRAGVVLSTGYGVAIVDDDDPPPARRPLRTPEQNEILGAFVDMLAGPTGDGAIKREAGVKPLWKIDGSHEAAAYRHLERWKGGEQVDADSGCHPLIHAAWRLLAVAYREMHADG
jgi:hypothetical protein